MKYVLKVTTLVLLFLSSLGSVHPALSQVKPLFVNDSIHRISGSIGGLSDFKAGSFLFGELGYSLTRHISLTASLHRDDTRENWVDGSTGYYVWMAPVIGARLSRFPNGRGLFVQGGIGYAQATLRVTEPSGVVKQVEKANPFASGKVGYRWSKGWGRKPKGLFLEAVLNYSVSWQDVVLQTDPVPVGTTGHRPTIDYHSWNVYKGQVGQTFLLGIGYTW